MKKIKISVVLATFNEEKNLARCLESVKELADEIVIADGTSSDNTVKIAKSFKAKVIVTTNKPNFHINKQMAIDAARGEWILQMDADEVVSKELGSEIKKIVKENPEENGYWMPRKNYFLGRFLMKGGQYPDYTIRLYRNGKGRLPQKDVHEQAVVTGKVGYLKEALLHYPYFGFKHYVTKWNKYNDFYAEQIREEQSDKNIFQMLFYAVMYLLVRPAHWLLTTYIRHKGFMDGWQGFTFSLFSALRFPFSYIKYLGLYNSSVILVIMLATFLRFYNFDNRWGLGGDDARDAMIGLEALNRGELPLMGPFSSAGPFVFGGIFYWVIMLSYALMPFWIFAPWVTTVLAGILTVYIGVLIGKELGGKTFAIILGLLFATSSQLVVRAYSLGPHTFVSLYTSLALLFFLQLFRTKKKIYAFLIGLFIGLALSFHYQALNLLIFFLITPLFVRLKIKDRLISLGLMILGFIIPSLPLLYWDYFQDFANIRNLADYFFIGQHRLYVPNSWRLFVFDFLFYYWSFVVGRFAWFAGFIAFAFGLVFAYRLVQKKVNYKVLILFAVMAVFLFVNRYYKGERSEGYLLYLAPFILIASGWLIVELIKEKNKIVKYVGIFILGMTLLFNLSIDMVTINLKSPNKSLVSAASKLYEKYPDTKFAIYDYKYKLYGPSMGLSLVTVFDGKSDINGKKIGISCQGSGCPRNNPEAIITEPILIVDLEDRPESDFEKERRIWIRVNKEDAYDDLIGWLNKHQLKSTFSLVDYLQRD